jgi:hypothetical protein
MYPTTSTNRSNFPTAPQKSLNFNSFPNDLVAPGRPYYMEIAFMNYAVGMQLESNRNMYTPSGGIRLPIPRKLNENQVLTWNEASATAAGAGAALAILNATETSPIGRISRAGQNLVGADAAGVASATTGLTINPFLYMFFQRPNYKQFSFSWTLAPNTPQESRTLVNMINRIKKASLPTAFGFVYQYPQIALIKLHPGDLFGHLKIKPCAIESISVDHTATATPAFFNGGAPVAVNLTINLKEIQLWDQADYGDRELSSQSLAVGAGTLVGAVAGARLGARGGVGGAIAGGLIGGAIGAFGGAIGSSF